MDRLRRQVGILCLVALALPLTGCSTAYWKSRGLDASDVFMPGLTVSPHLVPQFGLRINAFNVFPLGYANVDGYLIGWSNRQFGVLPLRDTGWGVVLYGEEYKAIGTFDPHDPHLLDQGMVRELEAARRPLPQEPLRYKVGILGLPREENSLAWPKYGYCPKILHLGWIGFSLDCNLIDLPDFILGWSGLDIVGDDVKP